MANFEDAQPTEITLAILTMMVTAMAATMPGEQRREAHGIVMRGLRAPEFGPLSQIEGFELEVRRMADLLFFPGGA